MKKLLILILCIGMCFAITGCKKNSYTGWFVQEQRLEGSQNSSPIYHYASFRLDTTDAQRKLSAVWVNLYGLEREQVSILLSYSNSSSFSSRTDYNYTVTKAQLKENGGWVKIYDKETAENEVEFNYVEIIITNTMTFNEIVFVNVNNNKLKPLFRECGGRTDLNKDNASTLYKYASEDEIEEAENLAMENGESFSSPLSIIDEQDKLVL